MEFDPHELRRGGGAGAAVDPLASYSARYLSDERSNRYGTGSMGSSSDYGQARHMPDLAHSTFLRQSVGPAGPLLRDPLMAPSYREDRELEIRRFRLRQIADRIVDAHSRMLEEHDRRAFAIAERAPYARPIPFYPELPPDNSMVNHPEIAAQHVRSPQRVAPTYHIGERHMVQKDLNLEPQRGPGVGVDWPSIYRREGVVSHVNPSYILEPRNGARSFCQPIEPVVAVPPLEPARNVWIDETMARDPMLQDRFTGYNMMHPSQIMHDPPPPFVVPVPVPVPVFGKKVGSSADTKKKRKKEYGDEVIEVQTTMQWSKWSCVLCSVNFNSKDALDAHLQEQHEGCKGDGPRKSEKVESNRTEEAEAGATAVSDGDQKKVASRTEEGSSAATDKKYEEPMDAHLRKQHQDSKGNGPSKSEKVEGNRIEEARTGVTVVGDDDQKELSSFIISEVLQSDTNKRIQLDLPPANPKQTFDKSHEGEVLNKKIQLELPPFSLKRTSDKAYEVQTPENKETAGSNTTKKIKLDLPVSTVQTLKNKEIVGSNIRRKKNLYLPPANFKKKPDEPSKAEVLPISESQVEPATVMTETGCIGPEGGWFCDLCKINTLTKRALDNHFQSNAHLDKLHLNGSKKSGPANEIVAEKPVPGVSQAVSVPALEEPKEGNSKSATIPQLDEKVAKEPVQRVSQAVSVPTLEEPKEENSKSATIPQLDKKVAKEPVQRVSQAVSVPTLVEPKEEKSKSVTIPQLDKKAAKEPVQRVSQAVSLPKLEEPKEASKFMPIPQLDKKVTSQNKGNPSSSSRMVVPSGHKKTVKPKPEGKGALMNRITELGLVMENGKWSCNLCDAKWMSEKSKEAHIKGKRHRQNLEGQAAPAQAAQPVARRLEAAKPTSRLHKCFICNIICTNEGNLIAHINGRKHRDVLLQRFGSRPEGAFYG